MSDGNKQQSMKELNDLADKLIAQAKDLKENGLTAYDQATGSVAQGVLEAQKQAVADLDKLAKDKKNVRDGDHNGWQGFKDSFHNFFANSRVHSDERHIQGDLKKSETTASRAEDNAVNSLNHTLDALQASRVAVLDAISARAKADEMKADLKV